MEQKSLREKIDEHTWNQFSTRLTTKEAVEVLRELFDYTVKNLSTRIDQIKIDDSKAISFFSDSREFLTLNITRNNLRIYIHPAAGIFFEPKMSIRVEKFNFWKSSYHKTSGKYRGISVWISKKMYLTEVKSLIDNIPKKRV